MNAADAPPRAPSPLLLRLAAAAAVAYAAWVVVTTMLGVAAHRSLYPYRDMWAIVTDLEAIDRGTFGLGDLFRQHNEHWIAIPRLLLYLDGWLGGLSGRLTLAMTVAVQLLHAAALTWLVQRHAGLRRPAVVAIGALLVAQAFAASQIENLIEPFQLQFLLVYCAATLALCAMVRAAASPRPARWIAAAVLAGVVSALSMANGLLVLPMLACAAFVLPQLRAARLPLATAAVAVVAVALLAYRTPPADGVDAPRTLASMSDYWLRVLGNACCRPNATRGPWMVRLLAGAALLAFVPAMVRALRRRGPAADLALVAVGLFVLATVTALTLGRFDPDMQTTQAGRYGTISLLFAAITLGLGVRNPKPWQRGATVALVVAMTGTATWHKAAAFANTAPTRMALDAAATACRSGVRDDARLRAVLKSIDFVPFDQLVGFLRERRWAFFADRGDLLLGQPLARLLDGRSPAPCVGAIDAIEPVPDTGWGLAIRGTARLADGMARPTGGVLVDGDDRIVGLCQVHSLRIGNGITFVGHAAARSTPCVLRAVLGDAEHGFLAVTGAGTCSELELATAAGSAIDGVQVSVRGDFAPLDDGTPAVEVPRAFALAGRSTAAGTGIVTFGPVTAPGVLGLPILTGPCTFGCGVQVVDRTTAKVVRTLRPAPTFGEWRIWRLAIPPELQGHHLDLVVGDLATHQDQWLAIAPPSRLEQPPR